MTNGQPGRALSAETIGTINKLLASDMPIEVIAQRVGVSASLVRNIERRQPLNVEQLAELVWPDEEPENGRSRESN